MNDFPITVKSFRNFAMRECYERGLDPYDIIHLAAPPNTYPTRRGSVHRWEMVALDMLEEFKKKPLKD